MTELAKELIAKCKANREKVLDIGNCGLKEIPEEVFDCFWLEELNLSDEYWDLESQYGRFSSNDGSSNNLSSISKRIKELKNLKRLIIAGDWANKWQITEVSALSSIPTLKYLDISHNVLTNINLLGRLSNLEILKLTGNVIQNIYSFGSLINLKELHLNFNYIEDIHSLRKNKKLEYLNLTSNQIKDVEPLRSLQNLKYLYISANQVTSINYLKYLTSLEELSLNNNKIKDFSPLREMTNLRELLLDENPIKRNSENIIKDIAFNNPNLKRIFSNSPNVDNIPSATLINIKSLRNYFRELETSNGIPNNGLKIILMGNTRAGKSQFLNFIKSKKYNNKSNSTHGIKIEEWKPQINRQQYHIQFFDFGGQDFYHATHNLFLAQKAFYLTLWNSNIKDENENLSQNLPLGYWLGNIDFYVQSSQSGTNSLKPTIWSIQSRGDEAKKRAYNESLIRYEIPHEGQFFLSTKGAYEKKSNWQFEWEYFKTHFERKIIELTQQVEYLTPSMVSIRDKILPKLRANKQIVISFSDFVEFCKAVETKVEYIETALDYLDGSGFILYYPNETKLKDYVFPDPQGLSEAIFKVLDNERMVKNNGEFSQVDVTDIFKEFNLPNEELLLKIFVDLLKHFEIIFEKPNQPQRYVVPQYLPDQKLETHLSELMPVSLVIKYNDYMPFWRISNFITQVGAISNTSANYWRYGIIYKVKDCTVWIKMQRVFRKMTNEQQKVFFYISGSSKNRIAHLKELFNFFSNTEKRMKLNLLGQIEIPIESVKILDKPVEKQTHFIKNIEVSVDNNSFFDVSELQKQIGEVKYCKNQEGKNLQIPTLFYPLLNVSNKVPKRVFFSYSHVDANYRKQLEVHLSALKKGNLVETWYDLEISAGDNWDKRIKEEIEKADIVLALISPHFMDSKYIWEQEIPIILADGNKKFIPIFLRHCDISGTFIEKTQGVPFDNSKPNAAYQSGIKWLLSTHWQYIDEGYLAVIEKIKEVLSY